MVSATCSWRRFSSRNFSRKTSIRVSACCAVNLVAWVFTVTLKPSTPNVFLKSGRYYSQLAMVSVTKYRYTVPYSTYHSVNY